MVLYYFIKIRILTYIFSLNLYAILLLKFYSFENIFKLLKETEIQRKKGGVNFIFLKKYHDFCCKILGVKNCLTKSISAYLCFRRYGYDCKIHISTSSEEIFISHASVSINNLELFKENEDLKTILTIG